MVTLHLDEDLRDVDPGPEHVDTLAPKAEELAGAQAAVRTDQHQRPVAGIDGLRETGDLGWREESHLLAFDLRQGGAFTRRRHDETESRK